jgi:hypothetical protein
MAYRLNAKESATSVSFFFTTWLTCIFGIEKLSVSGMKLTARWRGEGSSPAELSAIKDHAESPNPVKPLIY